MCNVLFHVPPGKQNVWGSIFFTTFKIVMPPLVLRFVKLINFAVFLPWDACFARHTWGWKLESFMTLKLSSQTLGFAPNLNSYLHHWLSQFLWTLRVYNVYNGLTLVFLHTLNCLSYNAMICFSTSSIRLLCMSLYYFREKIIWG